MKIILSVSLFFLSMLGLNVNCDRFHLHKEAISERKLVGLKIDIAAGSFFGEDFMAVLSSDELLYGCVFDEDSHDYIEKENKPIFLEEWQEIEEAVQILLPSLNEIPSAENSADESGGEEDEEIIELDGPNYRKFSLTWLEDDTYEVISYDCPANEKMQMLQELLIDLIKS